MGVIICVISTCHFLISLPQLWHFSSTKFHLSHPPPWIHLSTDSEGKIMSQGTWGPLFPQCNADGCFRIGHASLCNGSGEKEEQSLSCCGLSHVNFLLQPAQILQRAQKKKN